ncbi:unnamed protein product [marine sediment metagenome]|uniref:PAS domain-containing protein n=1 Tax=marine sediment metagenome TaxID=412755 RepID=X1VAG7_9ZZZZ
MRKYVRELALFSVFLFLMSVPVLAADIELAKKSTLERILKGGELHVGFESGYMPFEMTNKKGKFVGFDIDVAKEMAKAMGVKFVPINTAWDGIIPALVTGKFDIIISGMTVTQERNLKINFANPAAEALFGWNCEELLGKTFEYPAIVGETTEIEVTRKRGGKAVTEWLIEPVSKTGVPLAGTAGSNPALSAFLVRPCLGLH